MRCAVQMLNEVRGGDAKVFCTKTTVKYFNIEDIFIKHR